MIISIDVVVDTVYPNQAEKENEREKDRVRDLRILTQMPIRGTLRTSSMIFPIYMLPNTPQKRSGWSLIRRGPGLISWMRRAPSRMAMTTFAGIPRVKRGMKAPWLAELLADSGPATPSMAPVPNFSGCLETFFSTA